MPHPSIWRLQTVPAERSSCPRAFPELEGIVEGVKRAGFLLSSNALDRGAQCLVEVSPLKSRDLRELSLYPADLGVPAIRSL